MACLVRDADKPVYPTSSSGGCSASDFTTFDYIPLLTQLTDTGRSLLPGRRSLSLGYCYLTGRQAEQRHRYFPGRDTISSPWERNGPARPCLKPWADPRDRPSQTADPGGTRVRVMRGDAFLRAGSPPAASGSEVQERRLPAGRGCGLRDRRAGLARGNTLASVHCDEANPLRDCGPKARHVGETRNDFWK